MVKGRGRKKGGVGKGEGKEEGRDKWRKEASKGRMGGRREGRGKEGERVSLQTDHSNHTAVSYVTPFSSSLRSLNFMRLGSTFGSFV